MFLTSRDREMLLWINGHGFVTADQAAVWMGVCDRVGRRRLQCLVDGGYLQRKRFEFNDPQFHWMTKQGWQASSDSLAPPKRINRVTYFHDTTRRWSIWPSNWLRKPKATSSLNAGSGPSGGLDGSASTGGPRAICPTGFSISVTKSRLRSS